MRVLTVQQPWAWAIFHGKDVENRTQAWSYRGPLAIHAGARFSDRSNDALIVTLRHAMERDEWKPVECSAVLGVVQLVGAHEQELGCCESPWAEQSYFEHGGRVRRQLVHLVLEDPIEFEQPIPNVRGRLGLWTPDDDLADAIGARLEAAA
jgi:hypothetical protein